MFEAADRSMTTHSYQLYAAINGSMLPRRLTFRITEEACLEWQGDTDHDVRSLAEIRYVRLWTESPRIGRPSGRAQIRFSDGTRIWLSGAILAGAADNDTASTYRSFLQALHNTLAAKQLPNISFRRGFANGSPAKGWTAFVICVAIDIALVVFVWTQMRDGAYWIVRPAVLAFGIAGLVLAASVGQALAGRTYDPTDLPHELLPP